MSKFEHKEHNISSIALYFKLTMESNNKDNKMPNSLKKPAAFIHYVQFIKLTFLFYVLIMLIIMIRNGLVFKDFVLKMDQM